MTPMTMPAMAPDARPELAANPAPTVPGETPTPPLHWLKDDAPTPLVAPPYGHVVQLEDPRKAAYALSGQSSHALAVEPPPALYCPAAHWYGVLPSE